LSRSCISRKASFETRPASPGAPSGWG